MILFLTDTLTLGFQTIFGANVGFEIITKADFAKTGLPMKWSFLVNLFAVRFTLTRYLEEE